MAINMEAELAYLNELQEKILQVIDDCDNRVNRRSEEFRDSMRYLWENRSDMDTMEILSNRQSIDRIVDSGELSVQELDKMKKLLDSPYFARIDFLPEEEKETIKVYIGRFAFVDDELEFWVYDWRAPIASMYYDFETGPASYLSPMGVVEGEIATKRQYKVKNGRLEFVLESGITIGDEVLQRELSSNSDKRMKDIVATIQKEQNAIIRDEKSDVLVIQGVAGSGKTSVALHRVAFILYRYKEEITARNIIILSPNKVFADYISGVLPELGEQPIIEMSMTDFALELLPEELRFQRLHEQVENLLQGEDSALAERVSYKSSVDFLHTLDQYLEYADTHYFKARNYKYGDCVIEKEYIEKRFLALKNFPVRQRLEEMSDDLSQKFKEMDIIGRKFPSKKEVYRNISKMFRFSEPMDFYANLWEYLKRPVLFTLCAPGTLEYADVFPFIYLKLYLEGFSHEDNISHFLIDEMQDYTPVEYAVLHKLYPCKKTILGDFGQSVNPCHLLEVSSFADIFPSMDLVQLMKSYRSTYEIIDFAQKLKPSQIMEPIERHGDVPQVIQCLSREAELAQLLSIIEDFRSSKRASLGIVCKTAAAAKEMHSFLSAHADVHLLDSGSTRFKSGITVTSVFMAKGLEFDQVIVPMADAATYSTEQDRDLLYVACTRAMHLLTLTYSGEKSPLI